MIWILGYKKLKVIARLNWLIHKILIIAPGEENSRRERVLGIKS